MKITDLRNTQSMGWIADGYACSGAVCKISVPLSEVTLDELIEFALTDQAHDRYNPQAEAEAQAAPRVLKNWQEVANEQARQFNIRYYGNPEGVWK